MEYKVLVTEVIEVKRYYFVEADSKSEARKLAKNSDWYDACDVEYSDNQLSKIKVHEIHTCKELV